MRHERPTPRHITQRRARVSACKRFLFPCRHHTSMYRGSAANGHRPGPPFAPKSPHTTPHVVPSRHRRRESPWPHANICNQGRRHLVSDDGKIRAMSWKTCIRPCLSPCTPVWHFLDMPLPAVIHCTSPATKEPLLPMLSRARRAARARTLMVSCRVRGATGIGMGSAWPFVAEVVEQHNGSNSFVVPNPKPRRSFHFTPAPSNSWLCCEECVLTERIDKICSCKLRISPSFGRR